jgi:hypothetical protein
MIRKSVSLGAEWVGATVNTDASDKAANGKNTFPRMRFPLMKILFKNLYDYLIKP